MPQTSEKPAPQQAAGLILASGSPFRQMLLQRLGLTFISVAPAVDERPLSGEAPEALARRLAETKARCVGLAHPGTLVIGSDQVAVLDGQITGKPGDHEAAVRQLTTASGRAVDFLTAVCLLNTTSGRLQLDVIPCRVVFKTLEHATIEAYLRRERPYDCAGAFKSEGLGIALLERLEGPDPTALIGLPLIRLSRMLENEGIKII